MVGHELSRSTGTRSPITPQDLHPPQALTTTYDQQHSLPEEPEPMPSFLSHNQTNISPFHPPRQPDQATFEQTQRAVGNLLDALRTNSAQSHSVQDATKQASPGPAERALHNPELQQRPSISPLEPQSPIIPAPASTHFPFPGAQALDRSLGLLGPNEINITMPDAPPPPDDLALAAVIHSQESHGLQDTSVLEQPLVETVEEEEELPLNVQNAQDTGQISAFAKLEFDDGPFYITTYSLELGRDARAYRAAKARLAEQEAQQKGESSSSGNSHPSSRSKRDGGSQVKGSVVSDRGGFYGVDDLEGEAQEADEERERHKANGSHSSDHSASSIVNPKDLYTYPPLPHFNYQAYPIEEYEREIEEIPAPITSEHFPEQEEGFLLPIHHAPVKDDLEQDVANHRSVSRRHAKIFWEDDCFKVHIKGVNGAFVNEVHYPQSAIVPLREDVSIQIKGIKFQFKLPVHNSIESSEESDQVEDDSPNQNAGSSSATSGVEGTISPNASARTPLKVKIKNFNRTSPPPAVPALGPDGKPKRRGPGRPPKDGIMSKRERTAKDRADREAAAKAANGGVTPEPSNRGRSNRPAAKNAAEIEEPKPAKRKYTKRKSGNQEPDDVTPKLEEDSEGAVDDAPPAKRARVNRSESPEYPKLDNLSEKDLQRPPYNYSILIYDLLKDSPKPLDLKGIYRGLKMKWPHFLYRYKDAKGWESSVRHNVNEDKLKIIEKVDRVGKGYSYRAKPGVDIEQHKKKRARSPPAAQKLSAHPQQRYQQQPQILPPGAYAYPQGHQPPPPPAGHGMYGHLVPATLPQSSMSYPMSYPTATAGPYSSGAVQPVPQCVTSGPPPQQMAYTMATGSQSSTTTATADPYPPQATAYPTPPTPNQTRPGPYSNPSAHTPSPSTSTAYTPNQQHPPPNQQQHPLPPPPPPGVSPLDPFLPTGVSVISTFESSLLDGVENPADLPRIQATLASVRKRVFEGASATSLPGGETNDERTFLHYFRHILENERFRNPEFVGWEGVRRERERERPKVRVMGLEVEKQGPGQVGQGGDTVGGVGGELVSGRATVGLRGESGRKDGGEGGEGGEEGKIRPAAGGTAAEDNAKIDAQEQEAEEQPEKENGEEKEEGKEDEEAKQKEKEKEAELAT